MKRLYSAICALFVLLLSAPAQANGRMDYIPGLDPALRRHIQKRLKAEGFYTGPINGTIGTQTRAAIVKYRSARKIVETDDLEVAGDHRGQDLTLYLTPKLTKSLLGIDRGESTDELDPEQQIELMRQLKVRPTMRTVSPND